MKQDATSIEPLIRNELAAYAYETPSKGTRPTKCIADQTRTLETPQHDHLMVGSRRAHEPVTSMPYEWRVDLRVQTLTKLERILPICKIAPRMELHLAQRC